MSSPSTPSVCDSAFARDESADIALARISPLVSRTAQVVDDLLIFARLEAGCQLLECEKLRLDLLVETCLPEESAIRLDASPTLVEGDPRLLRVALRDLIDNARTRGPCRDDEIHVSVSDGIVTAADQGAGFPPEVRAVLQTSPAFAPSARGSGLGLTIARRIATLHGGDLALDNRSAGGAIARLRLGTASHGRRRTSFW